MILLNVLLMPPVQAAPAMPHEPCFIVGRVVEVTSREVVRDAGWARAWGIAERVTYHDVAIVVTRVIVDEQSTLPLSCDPQPGRRIFQIAPAHEGPMPSVDSCIEATVEFSGDEFAIGAWLQDVKRVSCREIR